MKINPKQIKNYLNNNKLEDVNTLINNKGSINEEILNKTKIGS